MTIQLISGPLTCGSMRLKSTDCKAPRQNTEVLPVTTAGSHSKPCNLKKGMNNKFSDAEKIDYSLQNLIRKISENDCQMPKTQPILVKQGWNTVSLWSFCSLVNRTVVKTCQDMFSGQNLGQNMLIAPVPLWDWTITSRPAVALDVYDQFGRMYQICHLRHMPWHNVIFQLTATWHASPSLPQMLRITEDYASPCQPHTKKVKGDLQPVSVAPASLSKPFSIFQLKKLKFKCKHPLWSKHVSNREFHTYMGLLGVFNMNEGCDPLNLGGWVEQLAAAPPMAWVVSTWNWETICRLEQIWKFPKMGDPPKP